MYDISGAVIYCDGSDNIAYALVRADGPVIDWPSMLWVDRMDAPTLSQLRVMSHYKFGPAEWSQDSLPRLDPVYYPVRVVFYVVDDAGNPVSSPGSYILDTFEEEVFARYTRHD